MVRVIIVVLVAIGVVGANRVWPDLIVLGIAFDSMQLLVAVIGPVVMVGPLRRERLRRRMRARGLPGTSQEVHAQRR